MKHTRPLRWPCGCIPGVFQCPIAASLWAAVNAAYENAISVNCLEAYDQARLAYDQHFVTKAPPVA